MNELRLRISVPLPIIFDITLKINVYSQIKRKILPLVIPLKFRILQIAYCTIETKSAMKVTDLINSFPA